MGSFEEKLIEEFDRILSDALRVLGYDDKTVREIFPQLTNFADLARNALRRDRELYEEMRQKAIEMAELVREKSSLTDPLDSKVLNCYIAVSLLIVELKKLFGRSTVIVALLKILEDYKEGQKIWLGLEDLERGEE